MNTKSKIPKDNERSEEIIIERMKGGRSALGFGVYK